MVIMPERIAGAPATTDGERSAAGATIADEGPAPDGERDMGELTGAATAPQFDPFSDEYFDHPYDLYRRMRDDAPVSFNEAYGFWALFRYDDVRAAHLDWQTFTSTHGVDLATLGTDPEVVRMYGLMIMMDPPEHERARSLVGRVFTPRAVAALEPMVAEVIDTTLAPFDDAESFDAVADFSGPFPVEIISRMLGVPEGERQQIRHWLDLTLERNPGDPGPTPEGMEAMIASWSYFADLTRQKRKRPGDDMISRLTQAELERPDGQVTRLSDEEIAGFIGLIGGAGAETVTKLVGNAVVLFDRHPDQYAKVVADPARIPGAVEEVLRILPPSQYQGRFSTRDSVIGGITVPAGSPVLLVTGSATRDERFFDRADQFDIERVPSQALGFGFGIHTCLGAALARMESRLAIEALARRWPRLAVDQAGCRRVRMSNVAGYSRVPVHRA
jgi:cytochrome P450